MPDTLSQLKTVYEGLAAKNPQVKQYGFDNFAKDMQNEESLKRVFQGLASRNPQLNEYGFDAFRNDMYGGTQEPQTHKQEQPLNEVTSPDISSHPQRSDLQEQKYSGIQDPGTDMIRPQIDPEAVKFKDETGENEMIGTTPGEDAVVSDTYRSFYNSSKEALANMAKGVLNSKDNDFIQWTVNPLGKSLNEGLKQISSRYAEYQEKDKEKRDKISSVITDWGKSGHFETQGTIGEFVGGMLPFIGMAVATAYTGGATAPALATTAFTAMGMGEGGEAYDEYVHTSGKEFSPTEKAAAELMYGLAYTLPMGSFLNKIVPKGVLEKGFKYVMKNPETRKAVLKTGTEIFEEFAKKDNQAARKFLAYAANKAGHGVATMEGIEWTKMATDKFVIGRDVTADEFLQRSGHAVGSGIVFGLSTAPFAYHAQSRATTQRRNAQGEVTLTLDKDGKPVEIIPTREGKQRGITPDGKIADVSSEMAERSFTIPTKLFNEQLKQFGKTGQSSPTLERDAYSERVKGYAVKAAGRDGVIRTIETEDGETGYVVGSGEKPGTVNLLNTRGELIPNIIESTLKNPKSVDISTFHDAMMKGYDRMRGTQPQAEQQGMITGQQPSGQSPLPPPLTVDPRQTFEAQVRQDTKPILHKDGTVKIVKDARSPEGKEQFLHVIVGDINDPEGFMVRRQDGTEEFITDKNNITGEPTVMSEEDFVQLRMQEYDTNIQKEQQAKEIIDQNAVEIDGRLYEKLELVDKEQWVIELDPVTKESIGVPRPIPAEEFQALVQAEAQKQQEKEPGEAIGQITEQTKKPQYPLTKDGQPDIDKMTIPQLFEFTKERYGEESAIEGLQSEIAIIQEKIDKANKKLEKSDWKTKLKTLPEIEKLTEELNNLSEYLPQVEQKDTTVPSGDNKKLKKDEKAIQKTDQATGTNIPGGLDNGGNVSPQDQAGEVQQTDVRENQSELEETGTISEQQPEKFTETANISENQEEKLTKTETPEAETEPVKEIIETESLQKRGLSKKEAGESLPKILGNEFTKEIPIRTNKKGEQIESFIERKISDDGQVISYKPKSQFVDPEIRKSKGVSTQANKISLSELENQILPFLSKQEKEEWEYFKKSLKGDETVTLKELRLPTEINTNKNGALEVRLSDGSEYMFIFDSQKEKPTSEGDLQKRGEIEKKREEELRKVFVEDSSPSKIQKLFERFEAGKPSVIRRGNTFDILINGEKYNVANYQEIVSIIEGINPKAKEMIAYGKLEDEKNTGIVFNLKTVEDIRTEINAKYDTELAELEKEPVVKPETPEDLQKKEEVKPIRQLGTGRNVYFETDKYRVNDASDGKVWLNVNDSKGGIVHNAKFDSPGEAVRIAKEFDKVFPGGVPNGLDVGKYVEQLKQSTVRESQAVETPQTEQPETPAIELSEDQKKVRVNTLIDRIRQYNQTPSSHNRKRSGLSNNIRNLANQIGYKVGNDQRGNLELKDAEGKPVNKKIAIQADKEVVENHKGINDYDNEEFTNFVNKVFDTENALTGVDLLGLSPKQVEQAIKNIREGKKSVAANTVLDALEEFFTGGYVVFKRGALVGNSKIDISMDEFLESINKVDDTAPELEIFENVPDDIARKINEGEGLTEQDIQILEENWIINEQLEELKELAKQKQDERQEDEQRTGDEIEEGDSPQEEDQGAVDQTGQESGQSEQRLTPEQQKVAEQIDSRIAEFSEEINKLKKQRESKLAEISNRNGLFGDVTESDPDNPLQGDFVVNQETINNTLKPIDEKIGKAQKELERLIKTRDTSIKEAGLQGDMFAEPEKQPKPKFLDDKVKDAGVKKTEVEKAESEVDTNPTEAQKEAGNYKKGHINFAGFDITIENPKGSERSGTDKTGKTWKQKLNNTYGYFKRTKGKDGDQIDVFLGDNPDSKNIFVIDQVNPNNSAEFDEHKVMLGFNTEDDAIQAYFSNYEPGWKGLRDITEVSKEDFKKWLDNGTRKLKPFAQYKDVAEKKAKDEQSPQEYKYHLRSRPFSIGTYPQNDDFVRFEEDNTPFGKVIYSKPLSIEDIRKFELVPEEQIEPGRYDMKVGNDYFPVNVSLIKTQKGHDAVVVNGVNKGYNANFSAADFVEGVEQGKFRKTEQTKAPSEQKEQPKLKFLDEKIGQVKKSQPQPVIEDFGEKIAGAKKDIYQRIQDITKDDIISQPFSKSFPRPDFANLVKEGLLTKEGALITKFLYDNIPAKPRKSHRVASWAKQVQEAIDLYFDFLSTEGMDKKWMEQLDKSDYYSLATKWKIFKEVQEVFGFPEADLNTGAYEIKIFTGNVGKSVSIVKGVYIIENFNTVKEAAEALKTKLQANKEKVKETKFSVYRDTKDNTHFIGKKGAKGVVRLVEGFKSAREAFDKLKNDNAQLQELWQSMRLDPNERRLENRVRVGTDYRKGKDITPEEFGETFKFRGVQFGNWVENDKRQNSLNQTYDALMDLSTAIGVSPGALSLGGELGMAFGARGSGKAMAHYESGQVVINLTKTKGAGSLAHEWWHALDNYFSRKRGERSSYITESPRQHTVKKDDGYGPDESVRKEMLAAFKGVVDAIRKSELPQRSGFLDATRSKDYWSDIIEMSARSFENFIVEKLEATNESNDYLANFKEMSEWIGRGLSENNFPYPTKDESPAINEAFQQFFDTIQEKVEDGKNILFEPTEKYSIFEQDEINKAYGSEEKRREAIERTVMDAGKGSLFGNLDRGRTPVREREAANENEKKFAQLLSKIRERTVLEDFKESGYVDFVGTTIKGPQDIADLWSIHRSPYIEKIHAIFLKDGKVAGTTAYTTNNLSYARIPQPEVITDLYKKYEADEMYFLHNHPSGNHKVSQADVFSTANYGKLLHEKGVNLSGHIVIDTDKFSLIRVDKQTQGITTTDQINDYIADYVNEYHYSNVVPLLFHERENISGIRQERLLEISKALLTSKGYRGAIIYLSQNLEINGYDVFPENASVDQIIQIAEEGVKNNIGSRLAFAHDGSVKFPITMPENTLDVINTGKGRSDYFGSVDPKYSPNLTQLWDYAARYGIVEPFHSPTERALERIKQEKGTPDQMKAMLLKNGAKQVELDWMGWDEAFTGKSVTKAEIQEWINQNKVEVEEVEKGDRAKQIDKRLSELDSLINLDESVTPEERLKYEKEYDKLDTEYKQLGGIADNTKYSRWQLPGGENYKELLLTLPWKKPTDLPKGWKIEGKNNTWQIINPNGKRSIPIKATSEEAAVKQYLKSFPKSVNPQFKSSHYEEPNIVAHVRCKEYTTPEERILMLEEIQSDIGENIRKLEQKVAEGTATESDIKELERLKGITPFAKTGQWVNLALRRMIRYAAENGFDRVAWTPGEVQAERYNLSKQVDEIIHNKLKNGKIRIIVRKNEEDAAIHDVNENELEGLVGKDVAEKIINNEGKVVAGGGKSLSGLDLEVGGEGMKKFYNEIVPNLAGKLGKKFGAKVETTEINAGNDINEDTGEYLPDNLITVQSLPVTSQMRETALSEGFPLFEPKAPYGERPKFLDDYLKSLRLKDRMEPKEAQLKEKIETTPKQKETHYNHTLIKNKIKAIKLGYKLGGLDTKENINKIQNEIVQHAKKNMPLDDAGQREVGKVLELIRDANTVEKLESAFFEIDDMTTGVERRRNISQIDDILKKNRPKLVGGKPVGRLNPDVYATLDKIREIRNIQGYEDIDKYVENLEVDDVEAVALFTTFGNLAEKTREETSDAVDKLNSIINSGRAWYQEELEKRKKYTDDIRTKTIDKITGGRGFVSEQDYRTEGKTVKKGLIDGYLNINQSFEWLMDAISKDKSEETGQGWMQDYFGDLVHRATNAESKGTRESIEMVHKKAAEIFGVERRKLADRFQENSRPVEKTGVTYMKKSGERVEIELSQNEAYKRWMEMQDPTLAPTFRKMGWDGVTEQQLEKFIKPDVKKWAEWQINEFYPEYYKGVNEKFRNSYFVNLPLNKKYSPIKREVTDVADADDALLKPGKMLSGAGNNSLKTRVSNTNNLLLVDGDMVLARHIAEMEHFKAWVAPMRELRSVLGSRGVQHAIKFEHGNGIRKVLNTQINDFASGGKDRADVIQTADKIRRAFVTAELGLNYGLFPKQLVSILTYMSEMPIIDYLKGMAHLTVNLREALKLMAESETVTDRYKRGWTHEVHSAMKSNIPHTLSGTKSLLSDIQNFLMIPTRAGDYGGILGGWTIYRYNYNQKMQEPGMTHEKAHEFALNKFERATSRSQQSARLVDTSELQKGSWGKYFTMFKNTQQQYFRWEYAAGRNLTKGRGSRANNIKIIALFHVLLPVVFQVVSDLLLGTDKEKRRKRAIRAGILGSLNGMLIVSDVLEFMLEKAMGEPWTYSATPIEGSVNNLGWGIYGLISGIKDLDRQKAMKGLELMAYGMNNMTLGLPYRPAKKIMSDVEKIAKPTATRFNTAIEKANKHLSDERKIKNAIKKSDDRMRELVQEGKGERNLEYKLQEARKKNNVKKYNELFDKPESHFAKDVKEQQSLIRDLEEQKDEARRLGDKTRAELIQAEINRKMQGVIERINEIEK